MQENKPDNRQFGEVPGVYDEDKPKVEFASKPSLRSTADNEVDLLIKAHNGTVLEVRNLLTKIGTTLLSSSLKAMFDRLGLDNEYNLKTLLKECNKKALLFQPSGLITMLGLQICAAYTNKMPLIITNKHNVEFFCVCGEKHSSVKIQGTKRMTCTKLGISVKASAVPRLALEFYTEALLNVLKAENEEAVIPKVAEPKEMTRAEKLEND